MYAPFSLEFYLNYKDFKLALKFKDFPAPTAIFKDFQGREFLLQNSMSFRDFQLNSKQNGPVCLFKTVFRY